MPAVRCRYSMLCALLTTIVCAPVLAEPQALITVNPNLFAPGQNVSHATYGATLRSVLFVPNPNAPPQQAFVPEYSPVFAEAVISNCILDGIGAPPPLPCVPLGNSVLSYISNLAPVSFPDFWGAVRPAIGCFDPAQGSCAAAVIAPLLRVDFAVPTDSVSVILGNHGVSDGDLEAFTALAAFDETGTNIGSCPSGIPPPGRAPCSNTIFVGPDYQGNSWVKVTFSDPSARIRFVVLGASLDTEPVGIVQFNSPVSVQLAGLLQNVQGVGPGKSLANEVMFAQTYYAVPDIQSTCAQLAGFVNEVKAQRGKHIASLTAQQLLSTATAIEVALGCREPEGRGPQRD
jgi:hypothetical protein